MTDSTGTLSETHSSSSTNEPTETQLAQAGDQVQVSEPSVGTSIQLVAAGDSLQLNFDPADVAKAEVKGGNLEITFENGAVAVVQGYEEWAAAGGQPTGPQGGAVDVAQLGQAAQPEQTAGADGQAPVCEIPNANIVDVPVPAAGERLTLAAAPGDTLRLACSFRDVRGAEVGDSLEMTFPGGGVVVVENFSAWIAAQGATITDCVCGGVNPADFIIALGLNPEDVLPAAGGQPGGPLPADSPQFDPGPGPEILQGFDHPHILPPTALGYGLPDLDTGLFPADEEGDRDLGGPIASAPDPLRVVERTAPLGGGTLSFTLTGFDQLVAADVDAHGDCIPPTGPVQFVQDQASGQIFVNDDFGPDGRGDPPLFSLIFTGSLLVDAIHGILQADGHTLRITSLDSVRPGFIDVDILTGLATVHLIGAFDHGGEDDGANVAVQTFNYTIQDKDGDKSTTQVTIEIVDSVPVAHNDCEVCIVEPGTDVGGNVMLNDDLGADQFLPAGTDLISFTYDNGTQLALVPEGGSATVITAIGGTLTVHSNGDWTYTPPASVDNSNGDVNDNFTYTIRDGDGDTSPAVQPICIQDGAEPEAFDNKQCVNEGATQNVMIIADVSGSMDDDDLDPGEGVITRLDLEKGALTALVNQYAALDGTVTITLIAFASGGAGNQNAPGGTDTNGARNLGTFTFSSTSDQGYLDAIAAINSLAIGMNGLASETEYDDALILAQQILADQIADQTDGTTNTVYFLSDGEPNPLTNGADATDWKNFVNTNNVEVIAVGIGNDLTTAELDKVEDNTDKSVIVDDTGDLAALLTNTATNASVSGNVLLDPTEEAGISPANDPVGSVDTFGSDGAGTPKIISLVHDGHTYDQTDVVGGEDGTVLAVNGGEITILTDLGGTLKFNFDTGDYTYTAPDVVDQGKNPDVDERFTYTIQDTDGDTDPADLVICIKDNVEPPEVTMAIGVDGNGACVEEDSKLGDPDNRVDVHAEAQADDTLTQLVITGFTNEPGWTFDLEGLKTAGVDVAASDLDASDGTITLKFNPDVKIFDGSFFVQPPADSDVDLGTLTATATAAAAGDPTLTLDSSTDLNVTVDANADPVEVTAFAISDSGGDGSFSPNETGTLHLTATFGDSQDGSETHTVTVEVPAVFNVTNPAGGVVTDNPDGSHTITFTLDTTGGSDDFSADIGIQATNAIAQQQYQFDVEVKATETTTGDTECDTSTPDNEATDTASTTTQGFDDHPTAYDNKQCVNEGATQNVMIIADVSGSMDDTDIDPDTAGVQTRLDLEKSSLTALVNEYAALDGTVTITLIAFASGGAGNQNTPGGNDSNGARNLGTFTFSSTSDQGYLDAIAAINSLSIGMNGLATETEYDDALILAQNVLTTQLAGQTDGTTNTVYFVSDGVPNPLSNGADATTWKTFVNDNNVEVIAVGIGGGVSQAELDKVEDNTDKSVIIDDTGDLAALLTNAAGNASVSGNVLLDPTEEAGISPANDPVGSVDDFGNDGAGAPKIISLVHDGHTYDQTDVVGGEDGTVLAVNGSEITILTDLGGTLKFDFDTGDYTYTAPDVVDQGKNPDVDERFTYTIQDTDGDTDPADLVICIKDNVEPPEVTMAIGVDGKGGCVEEDSKLGDPDNQVAVHAEAQADDTLTQLVITGFNQEPGWPFDLEGLKTAGVNVGASDFTTADGTITLVFNADVKVFDGSFFVQPPADSDVDLGTLTATATAAAAGDPTLTLDSSTNLEVTVDANADAVTVEVTVADSGDAGTAFSTGESGTAHVHATFGDFADGSEIHTVAVDVPAGFTYTAPAILPPGVTVNTSNPAQIVFTVPSGGVNGTGTFDVDFTVTNVSATEGSKTFNATVTANENPPSDVECDPSAADNIATAIDDASAVVANVGAPTIDVNLRSDDACVEEDSATSASENQVDLAAAAQPGDVLVNLVLTGFDPGTVVGSGGEQATWLIDIAALTGHPDVASVVYDTTTDTLTITFDPGVTSFTGSFGIAPPKDSDVDLGPLTGTVTAADGVDPTVTATASDSTEVNVDANADAVTVTLDVNDSGDANATFQQNETGTVHVTATFGDFTDNSEIHTVLVDVPAGFTLGALGGLPAGVTAQVVDGNNVLFTVAPGTGSLDYTFNVTNTGGGNGPANFTATATANENPPSDEECDPSDADNIKTVVDTENEQKQDDTPVINPAPVTVDDDDTPGFNGGPTDTVDPPNASATASLGASFGVDAPGTVVFGLNANPSVLSHGDAITYTLSGDSKTLTATADAGGPDQRVVYTVVINNDGTYTFTLLDALDHAPGGAENNLGLSFNVTATDADLNSTAGVINVTVNDDTPISTGGASGTVEEDNLPGGIDENAGINLTTSGSFGINFGADGPGDISTITGPAGLFSDGDPVTYSFNAATNTLTGSADGSPVFTVTLNTQTGQYNFNLSGPLDHPAGGSDEQALNLNFGFTATDFDGDPVNGSFTVAVRDDVPQASADTKNTADSQPQDINLVIVFDRSGSMADDPGAPGYSTRLELAKAAVAALFEAYESIAQDLHIKIVDFSTGASHTVWLDSVEEANAYLASLSPDGTTHYNDAIQELMNNYDTVGDPAPDADRTEVYFISDGKPNPASQSLSASGTVDDWENFLNANDIDQAFAVGIGTGIPANDPDLEDIAYKDANDDNIDDGPSSIVVVNESQLLATLVGTVAAPPVIGNLITDTTADAFGADGKGNGGVGIVSIAFNGHTYTYNQATNEIRNEANVLISASAVLALNTTLGGQFELHFDTGAYTYIAPNVNSPQVETFTYTIVDGDGDTSSAVLTINVSDAGGNVVTPLTHIGTDGNDNLNDSLAAADIIMSGGDGTDTLTGGAHNDHIQGGADGDSLNGGLGIDILIGGSGADTVVVGTGDLAYSGETGDAGQFGSDLIILKDNVGFGHVDGGFSTSADLAGSNRADILAFDGALDLTPLANSKIEGIETISMTEAQGGSGDSTDTLTLNVSDVIDLGTGHFNPDAANRGDQAAIKVDGEAGDTLNLTGGNWAVQANGNTPAGYTLYVHDTGGSNEDAYVLVQTTVAVVTS